MKVKFNLLFISFLLLIFPSFVYASTISVDCPTNVNQNSDFDCIVKGSFNENVSRVLIKYSYNSKLQFKNFESIGDWNLASDSEVVYKSFIVDSSADKIGNYDLAKITFTVANNTQGQNLDLRFYGFDATNSSAEVIDFTPSIVNKSVHINSTNNSLKTVTIDDDVIEINDEVLTYDYVTNKKIINMVGVLDSTTSTCEDLSRTIELNEGSNDIVYTVVAEDGIPKSYTFKIVYDKDSQGSNENTNPNDDNNENTSLESDTNTNNNNESNGSTNPFNPFTGDNIIFYVAILIICLIIVGFVLLGLKKKKNNK